MLVLPKKSSAITVESSFPLKLNLPCTTSQESMLLIVSPERDFRYITFPSSIGIDAFPTMEYCSKQDVETNIVETMPNKTPSLITVNVIVGIFFGRHFVYALTSIIYALYACAFSALVCKFCRQI